MIVEKRCGKCSIVKPLTEFHKSKQNIDGLKTECKLCRKQQARERRIRQGGKPYIDRSEEPSGFKFCTKCEQLRDEREFINSPWCLECRRVYHRNKYGYAPKIIPVVTDTHKQCCDCKELKPLEEYTNSKRGRKGKTAYCKPCMSKQQLARLSKEERRINTQNYRDNNREWWRSLHRLNMYKRRELIEASSDDTVTKEFVESVYSQSICHYCSQEIPSSLRTLEHKQPLSKGGLHSVTNIVMACLSCNCSKRNKTENQYKQWLNK